MAESWCHLVEMSSKCYRWMVCDEKNVPQRVTKINSVFFRSSGMHKSAFPVVVISANDTSFSLINCLFRQTVIHLWPLSCAIASFSSELHVLLIIFMIFFCNSRMLFAPVTSSIIISSAKCGPTGFLVESQLILTLK